MLSVKKESGADGGKRGTTPAARSGPGTEERLYSEQVINTFDLVSETRQQRQQETGRARERQRGQGVGRKQAIGGGEFSGKARASVPPRAVQVVL
ncbi:unnamed protein product [Boreogadus saida]